MTPTPRTSPAEAMVEARRMAPITPGEAVRLSEAVGRRLAESVTAARDLPEADVAAMDGWAVRASSDPRTVTVVGESLAGHPFRLALADGQACRIATGAVVPEGADAVARFEIGRIGPDGRVDVPPIEPGRDIRPCGSEVSCGGRVFHPGHQLRPHDIGVLAAVDRPSVQCRRRPRVAILGSGDELVGPGEVAGRPEVVIDSNLPMLRAQVLAAGGAVLSAGRVADDPGALHRGVSAALAADADVIITVGGASVGDRDNVRRVLAALGAVAVADGLSARPGHPVWLGAIGAVPILALPGNPGAALVMFHLLGRCLLGHEDPWMRMSLAAGITGRAGDDLFVRCAATADGLLPLGDQRPASIPSIGRCDAIAWIPAGTDLAAGGLVRASMLR